MGTFRLIPALKRTLVNNWRIPWVFGGAWTIAYFWDEYTHRTYTLYKGKSAAFGNRNVPEGEDPWKW